MTNWIVILAVACGAALPVLFAALAGRPAPDDWIWDGLMAIGFVAVGGIALLPAVGTRAAVRLRHSPDTIRGGLELHELLSYLLIAAVAVHAIGSVVYQPVLIEYLKFSAPTYMLAGLCSSFLLLVLIVQSKRPRPKYARHADWRQHHIVLSMVAIALMLWHVVGSGYYLSPARWAALLIVLGAIPSVVSLLKRRGHAPQLLSDEAVFRPRQVLLAITCLMLITAGLFVGVRL